MGLPVLPGTLVMACLLCTSKHLESPLVVSQSMGEGEEFPRPDGQFLFVRGRGASVSGARITSLTWRQPGCACATLHKAAHHCLWLLVNNSQSYLTGASLGWQVPQPTLPRRWEILALLGFSAQPRPVRCWW